MKIIYVAILFVVAFVLNGCGEKVPSLDIKEQRIEAEIKKQFPGKIKREGNKLIVGSVSGKEHVFEDNRSEENSDIANSYVAHLASSRLPGLDWLIVTVGYYENSGQKLISLTSGEMLEYDGSYEPILSPDKNHVLIYSQDIDAGFSSNYISVYQLDQNSINLEIEFDGDPSETRKDSWGPDNPRWLNNETLTYDELRSAKGDRKQATHIKLQLIKGKWHRTITGKSAYIKNNLQ
ncbi:MAG: hypothetical protein KJ958_00880 [Gammaproteobacteria bacterium]|nr:hypothetical protein [Gammaproteobacteria bacterium]MBU1977701.1 hypothetical protein [Gammaproteobacteria bacterium]